MLAVKSGAVKSAKKKETLLDEIDFLNLIHDLANVIDGTRRYAKLLTNEIPEYEPTRVYAESIQANLDRISHVQAAILDLIKKDALIMSKS